MSFIYCHSPQISPSIEHLWFSLEQRIRVPTSQLWNLQELGQLLLQSWCDIQLATYQHLVEGMAHHVQ